MTNKLLYDEDALLLRVSEGDEVAFTLLFERWQPMLATYIFRITRSRESAAEIVHDVFLKIWERRATLRSVDNFKSYLFVASRNHAINALKKTLRENSRLAELRNLAADNIRFSPASAMAETPAADLPAMLDEAIDRLSPRQRQVYLLHNHQLLSYREIAERLGIGMESVKSHMALASKAITKYLSGRKASLPLLCIFFF